MSAPSVDWHTVLAFALTGEWLALPARDGNAGAPDPDRLLADLASIGWSRARLAEVAAVPRVVPVERVRLLGPARYTAVLDDLRRRVLAGTGEVRRVSARPLDAEERRLAADRPPHWG